MVYPEIQQFVDYLFLVLPSDIQSDDQEINISLSVRLSSHLIRKTMVGRKCSYRTHPSSSFFSLLLRTSSMLSTMFLVMLTLYEGRPVSAMILCIQMFLTSSTVTLFRAVIPSSESFSWCFWAALILRRGFQ